MCTVSFIPMADNGFVLSSNRDEKIARPTQKPAIYSQNGLSIAYPKDLEAEGSWIGMSNSGRVCCLLNGAFEKHLPSSDYTYSRGLVLLDVLKSESAVSCLFELDMRSVEPFTLVVAEFDSGSDITLLEFRWDGSSKYHKALNPKLPQIWSSVTLYGQATRNIRNKWFKQWLEKHEINHAEDIMGFHQSKYSDNSAENVLMQKDSQLQTVSITQVIKFGNQEKMRYTDLITNNLYELELDIHECETA